MLWYTAVKEPVAADSLAKQLQQSPGTYTCHENVLLHPLYVEYRSLLLHAWIVPYKISEIPRIIMPEVKFSSHTDILYSNCHALLLSTQRAQLDTATSTRSGPALKQAITAAIWSQVSHILQTTLLHLLTCSGHKSAFAGSFGSHVDVGELCNLYMPVLDNSNYRGTNLQVVLQVRCQRKDRS